MGQHPLRSLIGLWGSLSVQAIGAVVPPAVALGLGLFACGAPGEYELGKTPAPPDEGSSAPGEASSGRAPSGVSPSVGPAPTECGAGFRACGGLLAGEWTVQGTCDAESSGRAALRRWGSSSAALDIVEALDMGTCPDATATLTTGWIGRLLFHDGVLVDERLRSDYLALDLTLDCLSAALGEPVAGDGFDVVCPTLSQGATRCAAAGGVCRCSAERQQPAAMSGLYGVLGSDVIVAVADRPAERIDYCVDGDTLHWADPATGQHVLLTRTGAAPSAGDPLDVPR